MLSASITINENLSELDKLFSFEDKVFSNGRAKYDVVRGNDFLKFEIVAEDSVALRSVLNTVTKIITVHEKTKKVIEDE